MSGEHGSLAANPPPLTPTQIQATGATFITIPESLITTEYTTALRRRGVEVYARWASAYNAQGLIDNGAVRLLVDRPSEAVTWFS